MLRISGYGQTGPYSDRPGFGVVAEAMGGLRHLTGEPGRVPVRVGVSIGDTLAALHGVIGILMALQHHRERARRGRGQVVDVALYEAVFNCMESLLPEYSAFGAVREAAGSALPGIAPTNAYRCPTAGCSSPATATRSSAPDGAIGRDDLGARPAARPERGPRRAGRRDRRRDRGLDRAAQRRRRARGSTGPACRRAASTPRSDIAEDPHYRARGMIERVVDRDGLDLEVPGIVPKLSVTPGGDPSRRAPTLGEDTETVLGGGCAEGKDETPEATSRRQRPVPAPYPAASDRVPRARLRPAGPSRRRRDGGGAELVAARHRRRWPS